MFLVSSAHKSYALFLQDAIAHNNAWYIGFVMIRFYFLWHKNNHIASGVRKWCHALSCLDARDMLLDITAHVDNDKFETDAVLPADWFVKESVIEEHIVPTTADMHNIARGENIDTFIKQLFYAEWIDLCQCINWESETQNDLLIGIFRDD